MTGPANTAPRDRIRIGIDLGGTKIEGIALDVGGGQLARLRINAPRNDYRATIEAVCGIATHLINERCADSPGVDPRAFTVGIGMPGSISPATGLVQNANSTWLNGMAFQKDIEAALGHPVRLANDANCFAVSEAVDGAGAGAHSVFGVILGTGVGGGLVIGGRIIDGPRGTGGEWGHNPLPWAKEGEFPGPLCWCGKHGCMEAWVSGPAMAADHELVTGHETSPNTIATLSQIGTPEYKATLERHCDRLARGLAQVINLIDPEVIVLGGGLSNLAHLYDELPGRIAPYLFTDSPQIAIRPPRWGDAGGARGAAWLWHVS
ncbi:MAG: ROK family protein [Alphaproteobacteria bacterium]|nr:ROK family protein [Alphaproteobacteria bacterium]